MLLGDGIDILLFAEEEGRGTLKTRKECIRKEIERQKKNKDAGEELLHPAEEEEGGGRETRVSQKQAKWRVVSQVGIHDLSFIISIKNYELQQQQNIQAPGSALY